RYHADIEDHFYYIGAICPQHFRPLQNEVVNLPGQQLTFFNFSFATWLYLLQDAPDSCVEQLMQRLSRANEECPSYVLEMMLAAVGTPAALMAIADYAERAHTQKVFRDLGFWLPGDNKSAEPRFTRHRQAIRFQPVEDTLSPDELAKRTHPVGLPVSFVAEGPAQDVITWHYVTLDLTQIDGLPATPFSRVHLVSPPHDGMWTLFCAISAQNLYTQATLHGSEDEDPEMIERLREQAIAYQHAGRGEVLLLLYDDQLVYRNGHTQLTVGVHGDVGGPPLGVYENPCCPVCGRLMFHVCTVASTLREYGDGFRSAFLCEECLQVASQAMGWN
ncbi:MAG: hypothetical protein M3Z08_10930, partial [Chloroflexota bacterium]|nr:hypothetical protein [Chloroflexota bacterium]